MKPDFLSAMRKSKSLKSLGLGSVIAALGVVGGPAPSAMATPLAPQQEQVQAQASKTPKLILKLAGTTSLAMMQHASHSSHSSHSCLALSPSVQSRSKPRCASSALRPAFSTNCQSIGR